MSETKRPGELKVALVHDWLLGMRGGEKVLEQACLLFPGADIHTLLYDPEGVSDTIRGHPVEASWMQRLPGVRRYYRYLLPLMPAAIESFRLRGYDLVLSFSHCVAKGVRPGGAPHLCYCFTPMRYIYGQHEAYFGAGRSGMGPLTRAAMAAARPYLQRWDLAANARVDRFVADSRTVAGRIRTLYGREAEVLYPPADTEFYAPDPRRRREGYALIVSALVPYKRVDLAIEASRRGGFPLKIAGSGPEARRLAKLAEGAPVELLGWRSDEEIRDLYRGAAAMLYPQVEDFGITAVEAQACGTPVVALAAGGALETVVDGETGVLFREPSPEALARAFEEAQSKDWDRARIRAHAEGFSDRSFRFGLVKAIRPVLASRGLAIDAEPC